LYRPFAAWGGLLADPQTPPLLIFDSGFAIIPVLDKKTQVVDGARDAPSCLISDICFLACGTAVPGKLSFMEA